MEEVKNYPQPITKKHVHAFFGLAGYYRQFASNFSSVSSPRSDLTKKAG